MSNDTLWMMCVCWGLDTNDWEGLSNNYKPAIVDIWVCYGWLCEGPRIPVDYHDLFPSSGEFMDVLCQVDSGSKSIEGPTIRYIPEKWVLTGTWWSSVGLSGTWWTMTKLVSSESIWLRPRKLGMLGNAGECWSKLLDYQRVKLS